MILREVKSRNQIEINKKVVCICWEHQLFRNVFFIVLLEVLVS